MVPPAFSDFLRSKDIENQFNNKNFFNFFRFFFVSRKVFCNLLNNKNQNQNKLHTGGTSTGGKQRKSSCKYRLQEEDKYKLVSKPARTIKHFFPDFSRQISELPDNRTRPQYSVKDVIMSGLLLFLFKQGSRNQADNSAKNLDFQDNIHRFFDIKVADNDTVDKYLRFLPEDNLQNIKQDMFRQLVKSKTLQKYKFANKYYMLAVDGSGLHSFDYEPYPGCPFKKHKTGTVWTTYVLEAKFVTSNGFSLSLATEWVQNPTDKDFDKQDCELEALKRMVVKLKIAFPRLPIVLLLDGLYPKEPIFSLCKKNDFRYIITLKDKSLKSVQEEISDRLFCQNFRKLKHIIPNNGFWLQNDYKYFDKLEYKGHDLNIVETEFEKKNIKTKETESTRFVHVTDIEITEKNVHQISQAGRLRWKIENEGFNNQKNSDYNAEHKFSRTNFNATKNYYQLLQIADIINQLTYKSESLNSYIKEFGLTIKSVIIDILAKLKSCVFDKIELIKSLFTLNEQFRY